MNDMAMFLDELYHIHKLRSSKINLSKNQEPDFGLFDFVGLGEVLLSNIFRWMLDPNETHRQGTIFLKKFLDIVVTRPDDNVGFDYMDLERTRVEIEDITENKRRLDIVLYHHEFIIAVENKLWAADQTNQVYDYLRFLKKQGDGKRILLIYVSPNGMPPSEESISKTELSNAVLTRSLQLRSHRTDIDQWLESCLISSSSHSVSVFINKLRKKLIDDVFEGIDMSEVNEIIQLIDGHSERLHSAMAIICKQDEIRKQLWNNFVEKFYQSVSSNKEINPWMLPESASKEDATIRLKNKIVSDLFGFDVGFLFYFKTGFYFSGLSYGIWFQPSSKNGSFGFEPTLKQELSKRPSLTKYSRTDFNNGYYRIVSTFDVKENVSGFYGHNWANKINPWTDMAKFANINTQILQLAHDSLDELQDVLSSIRPLL